MNSRGVVLGFRPGEGELWGGFQSVVLLLGFFLLVCVLANFGEFCAV